MSNTPSAVVVTIEAHGKRFVIIPDSEDPKRWASRGTPLSVSEIERLGEGANQHPLGIDAEWAAMWVKIQSINPQKAI